MGRATASPWIRHAAVPRGTTAAGSRGNEVHGRWLHREPRFITRPQARREQAHPLTPVQVHPTKRRVLAGADEGTMERRRPSSTPRSCRRVERVGFGASRCVLLKKPWCEPGLVPRGTVRRSTKRQRGTRSQRPPTRTARTDRSHPRRLPAADPPKKPTPFQAVHRTNSSPRAVRSAARDGPRARGLAGVSSLLGREFDPSANPVLAA